MGTAQLGVLHCPASGKLAGKSWILCPGGREMEQRPAEPTGIWALRRLCCPLEPGPVSGCLSLEVPRTWPPPWTTMPALLQLSRPSPVASSLRRPAPPSVLGGPCHPRLPGWTTDTQMVTQHVLSARGWGREHSRAVSFCRAPGLGGGVARAEVVLACCVSCVGLCQPGELSSGPLTGWAVSAALGQENPQTSFTTPSWFTRV